MLRVVSVVGGGSGNCLVLVLFSCSCPSLQLFSSCHCFFIVPYVTSAIFVFSYCFFSCQVESRDSNCRHMIHANENNTA